jgi:hypothetical protein
MLLDTYLPLSLRSWRGLGPVVTAVLWAALVAAPPAAAQEKPAAKQAEEPAAAPPPAVRLRFTIERHHATKERDAVVESREATREEVSAAIYHRPTAPPPDPELRAAIAIHNRQWARVPEWVRDGNQVDYARIIVAEEPAPGPARRVAYRFALETYKVGSNEVVSRKELSQAAVLETVRPFAGAEQASSGEAALWEGVARFNMTAGGAEMRRSIPTTLNRIVAVAVPAEDVRP